jgi:hypothetical protein
MFNYSLKFFEWEYVFAEVTWHDELIPAYEQDGIAGEEHGIDVDHRLLRTYYDFQLLLSVPTEACLRTHWQRRRSPAYL